MMGTNGKLMCGIIYSSAEGEEVAEKERGSPKVSCSMGQRSSCVCDIPVKRERRCFAQVCHLITFFSN